MRLSFRTVLYDYLTVPSYNRVINSISFAIEANATAPELVPKGLGRARVAPGVMSAAGLYVARHGGIAS